MIRALLSLPRIIRLREAEESLRDSARRLELVPSKDEIAAELFGRAVRLHETRLRELRRCGLL